MPPETTFTPQEGAPIPGPLSDTTVIVVSYFSSHCFDALNASLGSAPHIIVVDNSQDTEEAAHIAKALPHARLFCAERNLGFGAANNLGVRNATTPFVALINPDCPAKSEDIAALIQVLGDFPEAGAAAPQLIDRNGRPDVSYRASRTHWPSRGPEAVGPVCVEYASAAMLVVRRDAMLQINGFDEDFFLYYEDDDLCVRLTRDVGPIIVQPTVKVQHLSRQSSRRGLNTRPEYLRGYHHIQSKFLFQAKHQADQTSPAKRWGYAVLAGIECIARALLMDPGRAARAFGRVRGALAYRSPNPAKANR